MTKGNWNLNAEQFLSEEHSFPLVPGLTPVVNIENVKSELLGSPFTACVDHKLEPDYSVSGCRYRQELVLNFVLYTIIYTGGSVSAKKLYPKMFCTKCTSLH